MKRKSIKLVVNPGCELCAKVSCQYRGKTTGEHVADNGKYNCNTSKSCKE